MTEPSTTMATVDNLKTSNRGYMLTCELRNFPVTFVNAIRRNCLSSIPTVVLRDVEILENTTQIPHEMLKHRVEMLPVNVRPDDHATIRDAVIELNVKSEKEQILTTDDFIVHSSREKLLMKDRDLDTPLLFLKINANQSIRIKCRLAVEVQTASQVSNSTSGWHIDSELVKNARKSWVEEGKDPREFDNLIIQRHYSRNLDGRPNWFDLTIESIGVLECIEILKYAITNLRKRLEDYIKEALENIRREQDEHSFTVSLDQGGHTIGALLQEVIYNDKNVNFVSYDVAHPLRNTMILRFNTPKSPESILRSAKEIIEEYCSVVEKVL